MSCWLRGEREMYRAHWLGYSILPKMGWKRIQELFFPGEMEVMLPTLRENSQNHRFCKRSCVRQVCTAVDAFI